MEIERYGNGYTVFFEGDEVYFGTIEEAQAFIEEMEGGSNDERE